MKKYKYLSLVLAIIICITFYISWTIVVLNGYTQKMDDSICNYVVSNRGEKGNFLYYFNLIITNFGYTYAVIAIVIILLVIMKGNLKSLALSSFVGLATLFNELIKNAYKRPRPNEIYRWATETSYSYPSGHSNVSTIIYGSIIYLIIKSNLSKNKKLIFIPLTLLIPILIYISRIILSVHYFSDVIGGISNGLIFLFISILVIEVTSDKTDFDGLKPWIEKKLNKNKEEA